MDKTYCVKSEHCSKLYCPRHLGSFNGLYVSLAEFNCEEVLNEQVDGAGDTATKDR